MSSPDRIAVVLTHVGPIIGFLTELEVGFELTRPRGIALQHVGGNTTKVMFTEIVGKPERITFSDTCDFYHPTDRNIIDTYLQSSSPIAIASAIQPRVN